MLNIVNRKKIIDYIFKRKNLSYIIICLVIFAIYITITTFSRYRGGYVKSGNISIAKWQLDLDTSDNESDTLNIVSGNTAKNYILKIISTSEIAVNYSVIVSNLPNEIEVKIDDGNYQTPINNKITFNNIGRFNANDTITEQIHTLYFSAPLDSNIPTTNDIFVDVKFTQVNP